MPGPGAMMRNRTMKKEKADFKALKKLIRYCKPYLPSIIIAMIFAVGGSVATIVGPEKIGDLMNTITAGIISGVDMSSFMEICLTLVVVYLVGAILSY